MRLFKPRTRRATEALEISLILTAIPFLVFMVDRFLGLGLLTLGIIPRTWRGLAGILFAPLLHFNLTHLVANAFPLFTLLLILFLDRRYRAEQTLAVIWIISGLGTWLIGRPAIHAGASSVIYGLVTYLIASGYWMRSWRAGIVAALVFIFYGGIFYGVLPRDGFISWEGHLCGAISGLWIAREQHG